MFEKNSKNSAKTSATKSSQATTLRFYSWNVNGLRAVLRRDDLQRLLKKHSPDILALQEIKARPEQVDFDFNKAGYHIFWNPAWKAGYSGTAILIKTEIFDKLQPKLLGLHDAFLRFHEPTPAAFVQIAEDEGRIQILEFPDFYFINVYTPNSKPELERLNFRYKTWDPGFLKLLKTLDKPVITCGDFNAAHEEIDIARPKTNHKSAGFTDEERKGVTNILANNFIDTFRAAHPDEVRYTWWSHYAHARMRNIGWRIDYFFASNSLMPKIANPEIYDRFMGSDHCPVGLDLILSQESSVDNEKNSHVGKNLATKNKEKENTNG